MFATSKSCLHPSFYCRGRIYHKQHDHESAGSSRLPRDYSMATSVYAPEFRHWTSFPVKGYIWERSMHLFPRSDTPRPNRNSAFARGHSFTPRKSHIPLNHTMSNADAMTKVHLAHYYRIPSCRDHPSWQFPIQFSLRRRQRRRRLP